LAYGFLAISKELLNELRINHYDDNYSKNLKYGQGFEIETLMFCRAARRGINLMEVPSFEKDRIAGASNLRAIRDGVRVLVALFVERARSVPKEW
jgi:hypothetical protein